MFTGELLPAGGVPMNYEVRAIFYEGGDEPKDSEQGLLVANFEAESIESARGLAQASIDAERRGFFSKVFRVYRLPSQELACEIVRPAAYEVDGLYGVLVISAQKVTLSKSLI
jgi:hypothetical protein